MGPCEIGCPLTVLKRIGSRCPGLMGASSPGAEPGNSRGGKIRPGEVYMKAQIVQKHYRDTQGKERGLLVASRSFLAAGIIACLCGVAATALTGSFLWLAAGVVSVVAGGVLFLLFGALSEIIILLKNLLGLPVKGAVSGTQAGTVHLCSACGNLVWPDSEKCDSCGADLEA